MVAIGKNTITLAQARIRVIYGGFKDACRFVHSMARCHEIAIIA